MCGRSANRFRRERACGRIHSRFPGNFSPARRIALFANATSMDNNSQSQPMPNGSEPFRTVPKTSESFGKIPHATESFGNLPNTSERTDNHTLTVREVARMFEAAGVARTERSIVNWCQPNPQGMARLDAYFDMNDRRWFITPQSVESAIAEEQAKAAKMGQSPSEPVAAIPQPSEIENGTIRSRPNAGVGADNSTDSEKALMDLRILNRGKDYFIEQLQKERELMLEKLVSGSHRIGELETHLRLTSETRNDDPGGLGDGLVGAPDLSGPGHRAAVRRQLRVGEALSAPTGSGDAPAVSQDGM